MKKKRDLMDAVNDRLIDKQPSPTTETKRKQKNYAVAKILVSLILGFAGGLTASRWIKIV
jgi:hypothetical protein